MRAALLESRREGAVRVLTPSLEGEPRALLGALEATERELREEVGTRVVVLELDGDPPLELSEGDPDEVVEHARRVQAVIEGLRSRGRVLVAALSGRLEAVGRELAWAAHVVVAAEGAWLLPGPVTRAGLSGFGGFQRLARRVGAGKSIALVLLGEPLSAKAASDLGLVDVVAPAGEHLRSALAIAQRCAAYEPAALDSVLELLDGGAELALEDALELEAQHAALLRARRREG